MNLSKYSAKSKGLLCLKCWLRNACSISKLRSLKGILLPKLTSQKWIRPLWINVTLTSPEKRPTLSSKHWLGRILTWLCFTNWSANIGHPASCPSHKLSQLSLLRRIVITGLILGMLASRILDASATWTLVSSSSTTCQLSGMHSLRLTTEKTPILSKWTGRMSMITSFTNGCECSVL